MEPDVEFSPEKNKFVIENSIRKYEAMIKARQDKFKDNLRERTDAVASYLKHVDKGGVGEKKIEKYFSEKMFNKLRGLEIVDELRNRLNMITAPSPIYVEGGMVKNSKGDIVGREVSNAKKKSKR
jgi:hypothetical protein